MPNRWYKDLRPQPKRKQSDSVRVVATADPQRLQKILAERQRRRVETLKVLTLTPKQRQVIECISRIILTLGANRSGKSSLLAIHAAMIVLGIHPTRKFPRGYEGRLYFVAKDATAIGEVFFKKLFKRGEFKVIRDFETGEYRSFHPVIDKNRPTEQIEQAPPLIPRRFIDFTRCSYRNKALEQPQKIVVKNHLDQIWELSFFTGEGEPQRGVNIDGAYFSEELTNPEWYNETIMRLTDRKGFLFWDAAQQDGSDALSALDERADKEAHLPNPHVWKSRWSMYDNPFIDPEEIEVKKRELLTEDDVRVRIYGEAAVKKIRLFPEFTAYDHWFRREWLPNGQIPANWCRYMALDPGYELAAAIFLACPPPEFIKHKHVWLIYDEMYASNQSIEDHVKTIASKIGNTFMHAFIIDDNQASKHMATGQRIRDQYSEEMRKHRVSSEATGTGFWVGFDDVRSGTELVRTALRRTENGMPRLMFLEETCPNAQAELRSLKRDKRKGKYKSTQWLDVPASGQNDAAFDCLRYLCGADPKWRPLRARKNWADLRYAQWLRERFRRQDGVVLGPRPRS